MIAARHRSATKTRRTDHPMQMTSAVVLTATTGKNTLDRTIASVLAQTHENVVSYVVVDGEEYFADATAILDKYRGDPRVTVCYLPRNTGADNYFCHRIYGAFPLLVNQDFVFFCNHDDWFDEDHVEKNVTACIQNDCAWSFSPRKIMAEDGTFVCNDECESLGFWPVWYNPHMHHIDANCYCLRRDLAIAVSPIWHRRRVEQGKAIKCADTEICEHLLRTKIKGCLTHGFSVNFSVGGNQWSPGADFFLRGNAAMVEQNRKPPVA
ncbi:MAG: glycosyltransferase family A protein [Pirellulales bacterium]